MFDMQQTQTETTHNERVNLLHNALSECMKGESIAWIEGFVETFLNLHDTEYEYKFTEKRRK